MFKRLTFLILFSSLLFPIFSANARVQDTAVSNKNLKQVEISNIYKNLPLYFLENKGQVDQKIRYFELGQDHATYFAPDGVYLKLFRKNEKEAQVKLALRGANQTPNIVAENLQSHRVNYFIGASPEKWLKNVSTYAAVRYKDVYEGVDIRFYGNNRALEYDVIVKPGVDPSIVRLTYEGVQGLKVNASGELEVRLQDGKLIHKRPYIYQEIDGRRVEVKGAFRLEDRHTAEEAVYGYRFEVAAYDKHLPLIIDPILDYSTFLGGSDNAETGIGIAVDSAGAAYVTGTTSSANFLTTSLWPDTPSPSTLQDTLKGGIDVFVTKFNAEGTGILYSTFLGGSSSDEVTGIALDPSGNVYITGKTLSSDFPVFNAIQTTRAGGSDGFVAKIDASGSVLDYSTYLGGGASDIAHDIAVDLAGNAYIIGETNSTNFPTDSPNSAPLQPNRAGNGSSFDAFLSKINGSGTSFVYSTYLGGGIHDYGYSVSIDLLGNAYIAGKTTSFDFPILGDPAPYQNIKKGFEDIFVAKINVLGEALIYATYLGGNGTDEVGDIALDVSGNAYLAGRTTSTDFPITAGVLQTAKRIGWDGFLTKLNTSGTALVYSTYFGGDANDAIHGIAVDPSGSVYMGGETTSRTNFPIVSAIQSIHGGGGTDAFISRMNTTGTTLIYSTYLGGSRLDESYDITIDSAGSVYTTGRTGSGNFPVVSNTQSWAGGGIVASDAFVSKISEPVSGPEIQVTDTALPGDDLDIAFGNRLIGESAVETLNVKNLGDTDLVLGTLSGIAPSGSPFVIENDQCSDQTLAPFETCSADLHFSPLAEQNSIASFEIPSNDSDENPVTVTLQGQGVSEIVLTPDINLSRTTVSFGNVTIGVFGDESVSIENLGDDALILGQIGAVDPVSPPFSILSDGCSNQTLAPTESCVLGIRFSPTAEPIANDTFDIPSNDPDENPVIINLNGSGTLVTIAKIVARDTAAPDDDLKLPFGTLTTGQSALHQVTLTNAGNLALVIGTIAQNNPLAAPFVLQNDLCSGVTLAPTESCTFDIIFSPTEVIESLDSIDIPSSDLNQGVLTLNLSGTGTSGPSPDLRIIDGQAPQTDLSISFGDIITGRTVGETITLANIGSATLVLGKIADNNAIDAPFEIVDDQCSNQSLPLLALCTFEVHFKPVSIGIFNDTFDIPSNDPDPTAIFSVNGGGVQADFNNAPSKPVLVFPANGQQNLSNDLSFEWERATDPDGDPVSYTLFVCDDPDPQVCAPALEAAPNKPEIAVLSYSAGFFLVGIVFLSWGKSEKPKKNRKAARLLILFLFSSMLLVSCSSSGGGSGGGNPAGGGGSENEQFRLNNPLQSGKQYFWMVVAKDDQGGENQSDVWHFTTQ